jgi:toxin ParE1/3/4
MAYLVKLMPRAKRDLRLLFGHIHAGESGAAFRWYQGLEEQILSLDETPNRCPTTPEIRSLRHLLYGRKPHVYRVIYRVLEEKKQVDVLHVRHGARRGVRSRDIAWGDEQIGG